METKCKTCGSVSCELENQEPNFKKMQGNLTEIARMFSEIKDICVSVGNKYKEQQEQKNGHR